MAHVDDAIDEVRQAVRQHFQRSTEPLRVEQVVEMTALDQAAVTNALAVLYRNGEIEGADVAELGYPIRITGFRFHR